MTLEIRMFKNKKSVLTFEEPYIPSPDDAKELISALDALSKRNVIAGYIFKIDNYSPHFEE
jgi:hypothetical protein